MKSNSNRSGVRQFGQLSLLPSFRSKSSSKDCEKDALSKTTKPCVSLSDFLGRKLNKATNPSIQEKQTSFSSFTVGFHGLKKEESKDHLLLNEAVFQPLKRKEKEDYVGSNSGVESGEFHLEHTDKGEDSRKRKSPFAVSKGVDESANHPGHLVVLGDDPKPKRVKRESLVSVRPKASFNHYANGNGWWHCDMEGVDNEEVGCDTVWEGIGSTTLGGLEWH